MRSGLLEVVVDEFFVRKFLYGVGDDNDVTDDFFYTTHLYQNITEIFFLNHLPMITIVSEYNQDRKISM